MNKQQEPVAWVCHGTHDHNDIDFLEEDIDSLPVGTNLYTSPPQRQWVGLTEKEVYEAYLIDTDMSKEKDWTLLFYEAIEAKLKEKNCI